MRVLFVSPEIFPLMKTGGLGDVAGALPDALAREGIDIRLLMPAYRGVAAMANARPLAGLGAPLGLGETRLLEGRLPGNDVPVWLIDNAALFDRDGGPYQTPTGVDWTDNPLRFALLGWVAARLSQKDSPIRWRPDIVHGHDWQAGLAGAYLTAWGGPRPGVIFTIHNMVFPGMFPPETVPRVELPWSLYTIDGFEYWSHISYLKAGIVFADKLTTVSPTYAREIQGTPEGCGMEGLLASRAKDLSGILNGADYAVWDPSVDRHIAHRFDRAEMVAGKAANKAALQRELGLPERAEAPLLAVVSRLSDQKGMDLVLAVMPVLLADGIQFALLGTGDRKLEAAFADLARAWPTQVATRIGYSEPLAHRLVAGADILLMPSRFEPCGLTQIYAMRFGTLPVVHRTGGLADTVTDATYDSLLAGTATGFLFDQPNASSFQWCAERAIAVFGDEIRWRRMQEAASGRTFGWDRAARNYLALYREVRPEPPPVKRRKARANA